MVGASNRFLRIVPVFSSDKELFSTLSLPRRMKRVPPGSIAMK